MFIAGDMNKKLRRIFSGHPVEFLKFPEPWELLELSKTSQTSNIFSTLKSPRKVTKKLQDSIFSNHNDRAVTAPDPWVGEWFRKKRN